MKRTYNLRPSTVQLVQRLVERDHVAPTQDALVERAIQSLARRIRDDVCAQQYAQASTDPAFKREWEEWERGTMTDEGWE